MKKTAKIPALVASILLTGSLIACADPGSRPTPDSTAKPTAKTGQRAPLLAPKAEPRKKTPVQVRPVDVEPQPFSDDVGEVYEFRAIVDEVWRYCLVFVSGSRGGMHCFDSSEVP